MTLVEKRQERGRHVEAMRKMLDTAQAGKRSLTAEETAQYDQLDGAQEALIAEIKREERVVALEAELRERTPESGVRPEPTSEGMSGRSLLEAKSFERLFGIGTRGLRALDPEIRRDLEIRASDAYRDAFGAYLHQGVKSPIQIGAQTLQMDVFTRGGALVAPMEFVAELIKAVDDAVYVRQFARKFTVTLAEAMGAPTLDTDPADADWTSELATGSAGTMAFGRRELRPHPLAKRIKVSNKLMRASAIPAEGLVRERLAYKFGITNEKAFLTGDGVQKPLGVFTASADGVTTARDVSTGNSTTAIGADGLIEAKHAIKSQYWPRLRWAFHRDAVKQIRKLKDGNGQYLWAPGLSGGLPDRILEMPYDVSEYVPNTFTTGLYVGIAADWSQYWIVDALDLTVQRLVELYAETNETGFIGRMETDGAPVLAEAFARVKLA